jgi:hypothetical protein
MVAQGPESNRLVTIVDSFVPGLIRRRFRRLNRSQRQEDHGFDVKYRIANLRTERPVSFYSLLKRAQHIRLIILDAPHGKSVMLMSKIPGYICFSIAEVNKKCITCKVLGGTPPMAKVLHA